MIIANLIGGVICLVFGLIIQTGKANFLIAGYNTMSKKEQSEWDAKALSKFTGWVLLVLPSVILLLVCIPISLNFFPYAMLIASWVLFTLIIIVGSIYINISRRFRQLH